MPGDNRSSSENSSDSFQSDHGMQRISTGLEHKWEAVEEYLYQDGGENVEMSPGLVNECKLWKESFPYLRVRGERIDHPLNLKKSQFRQQVIATVVDQLIEKIRGEGLDLSRDKQVQRPAAPSKESYFERGKVKNTDMKPRSILKKKEPVRKKPNRTSSFKNSSLPRISAKNNNWLARSERRESSLPSGINNHKTKNILPPITQKSNIL